MGQQIEHCKFSPGLDAIGDNQKQETHTTRDQKIAAHKFFLHKNKNIKNFAHIINNRSLTRTQKKTNFI